MPCGAGWVEGFTYAKFESYILICKYKLMTKFGDLALGGPGPASEGSAPGGSAGVLRMDCGVRDV